MDEANIAISISDTGPGIPEDALERIFDPFFTTKRESQGTGLGLSISRTIIQQMGGDLVVSSVYGDGATFSCFLPLPTNDQVHGEVRFRRRVLAPAIRGIKSVLLVDDDDRVLRTMSRALREKYKVMIARDGQEACDLLLSGSHADAIVMELDLPEMDGPRFFDWLREHLPELTRRIVVATGAQESDRYREFLEDSTLTLLPKPMGTEALLEAVAEVLSH
jgi:CheY-like chemotaxis protein